MTGESFSPRMTLMQLSLRVTLIALLILAGCVPEPADDSGSDVDSDATTAVETVPEVTVQQATTTTSTSEPADAEQTGKVVAVLDGDTIDILNADNTTTRIRFNGIDCPERGQPFGNNAKQFLSDTIGGKVVRIVEQDTDRYGRTIADVYLPADVAYAGSNPAGVILPDMFLNRELVQRGLAWHYKQYSDDERLAEDENRARAAKLGLWSDPRHVAPWEWRKLSKEERDSCGDAGQRIRAAQTRNRPTIDGVLLRSVGGSEHQIRLPYSTTGPG
jgi:micrococcal nuclease